MRKIFVMVVIVSCISFFVQGSLLNDADAKHTRNMALWERLGWWRPV